MSNQRKTPKRIHRPLTDDEVVRLAKARHEAEAARDEIAQAGRIARKAWEAMRGEVGRTVAELRAERERLGLSLADVEQRSGLRRSALSRLENDEHANPTWLTLERYAVALGMRLHATLQRSDG